MIRQKREYHAGRTQYIVHWTFHTQLNSATCGFAKDIGMEEGMFMTLSIEDQELFRVGGWLRIQSLVQLVDAMTISPVDNVGISDCYTDSLEARMQVLGDSLSRGCTTNADSLSFFPRR